MAVELKNGICWVGAVDWSIRDFHGYETPRGTSYNNYLIMDEQVTLVDTVKHSFVSDMVGNIERLVDPAKIKNVIVNHIENDHATSLGAVMRLAPDANVYITEKGKKGIARFFDISKWNINVVKTGDTLNIGGRNLVFLETPMLHWPDSMMTYIPEDKLLISQDGFGQHIASAERFDDEYIHAHSQAELDDAVADYYANILMPFGSIIKSKLAEVQKLGLDIEMIAPDHGVIWRKFPQKIVQDYLDMADGKADLSVAIIYDTMWRGTEMMTVPLTRGIIDEGVACRVVKLRANARSIAVKEFWKARGALIGTPTLNNLMFPTVASFLAYLRGLKPKNRIVGAFGSYGWGGGGVKNVYEELGKTAVEVYEPGIEAHYRPDPDDETKAYEYGRDFAKKVKEYHGQF
ncbi:MAG: FprA family A-type flavoprotein [Actinobacteria bacterium]|nr:FprA family A-type flavoprotein [Actinomycetota bacterium]